MIEWVTEVQTVPQAVVMVARVLGGCYIVGKWIDSD